jgi:hypothetical protein
MEQSPQTPEVNSPSAATAMSLGTRLLNVFAVPGEVFEHVKSASVSHANWLVPAFAYILVSWIGVWVIFSQDSIKNQLSETIASQIEKAVEAGKMQKSQMESAQQAGEKIAMIWGKIAGAAVAVFIALVTPFWGGLIVWLAGAKVLKGSFTYMKGVEVSGLALTIAVLGEIVRILLVVVLGNLYASPSLALLVRDPNPQNPMTGVLGVFNVFLFWELGVRSLGLVRLSGAPFGKAALWVFGVWAAITGVFIGIGLAFAAAFRP